MYPLKKNPFPMSHGVSMVTGVYYTFFCNYRNARFIYLFCQLVHVFILPPRHPWENHQQTSRLSPLISINHLLLWTNFKLSVPVSFMTSTWFPWFPRIYTWLWENCMLHSSSFDMLKFASVCKIGVYSFKGREGGYIMLESEIWLPQT